MPNYGEDRFTDEQLANLRVRTAETLHEIDAERRRRADERKADEGHCHVAAEMFLRGHISGFSSYTLAALTGLLQTQRALARANRNGR